MGTDGDFAVASLEIADQVRNDEGSDADPDCGSSPQ
jgi:hypothetical protein